MPQQHKPELIRNIAFVGHGSCGKTTLLENVFAKAGLFSRPGSVEDGHSNLDFEEEERARKFGIDATMGRVEWGGCHINFADTPGYPEFFGGVLGALRAVEAVAIVIAAPAGIELNTRRTWDAATNAGKARFIIVNKMDGENIQFDELVQNIHDTFGANCVPYVLPIGQGTAFKSVAKVLEIGDQLPAGILGDPESARSMLMDAIMETDEALMERYLEDKPIAPEEVQAALRRAVGGGNVVPMFFTSGRMGVGIQEMMDLIAAVTPSPLEAPALEAASKKDGQPVSVAPDPNGPFVADVFKTTVDPYVGKLTYLRVFSGSLDADTQAQIVRSGKSERIAQPMCMLGKDGEPLSKLVVGDIAAIGKMDDVHVNDTLYNGPDPVVLPNIVFPTPMVSVAVEPKSRNDEQRLSGGLEKLADEDPTFRVRRDTQTHELVVQGMSALHVDIMLSRLKRRFGVEVTTKEPKIPYRETISAKAEASHRHKKQTGGRGQFAEVHLRVAPRPRGSGFEFVDDVVGGVIPRQFIPAVEKGIRETLEKGVFAGYPVDDVQASVFFGKFHPVDSSEAAFKMAASMAFKEAFLKAQPVLLEPVVRLEVTAPTHCMGDITSDLSGRRARIEGMDSAGDMQIIRALAPLSEVSRYATELRSITGGAGFYTMEFSHLDVVPAHVAEQVIKAASTEKKEE